jgi:CO dehydrogenase maturation factor
MRKPSIIALCGKGGVGKTSISAMMVGLLARANGRRVLAIDADPAVGLAAALGITVRRSVDDIRKDLIAGIQKGRGEDAREVARRLDYDLFDALEQGEGFSFLAIGRPEDEGCYCRVNSLLKDIISDLAGRFDIVLIDGEAGVEQINRRVMKTVDCLLLVSDTSAKGVSVAETIARVASVNRAVDFKAMGLVLNRVRSAAEVENIRSRSSLDIYGWILEDDLIRDFDFHGRQLTLMPGSSPALGSVVAILEKMNLPAR